MIFKLISVGEYTFLLSILQPNDYLLVGCYVFLHLLQNIKSTTVQDW
mgnify:CR=1 FL=1